MYVFNDLAVLAKSGKSGIMAGSQKPKDKYKAQFFFKSIRIVDIADTDGMLSSLISLFSFPNCSYSLSVSFACRRDPLCNRCEGCV